jgi:hypothetical protein
VYRFWISNKLFPYFPNGQIKLHGILVPDYFATHQILQNGRSNWLYLQSLWDSQVFLYNLFTCTQGHGNPCNHLLGVPPPTVAEYLFSANNNLLVPLITNDDEDDNFANENDDDEALYYHLIF